MHDAVVNWVMHHQPHPRMMGSFFRSVLCNELVDAWACADWENRLALAAWAEWLHMHAPVHCWGSIDALYAWHDAVSGSSAHEAAQ
jgi:hypothetical protein